MRAFLMGLAWCGVMSATVARGVDPVPPLLRAPAASGAPAAAASATPRIQFADRVHDFGRMRSGEVVRHDFVYTNTGNATLVLSDVRPGCGCTTAGTWDREIAPGGTGRIPIQFNGGSFSGNISKTVTVTCNDPANPTVMLQLKANIWTPVTFTPASLYFALSDETAVAETKVVKIVSNLDEPLTLSDPVVTNRSFTAVLKPLTPGREYELHVTPVLPLPGSQTTASFMMKTTSKAVPDVTVHATATVQPTVSVFPSILTLAAGPAGAPGRSVVTIRNSGAKALELKDPKVNLPGAKVEVNELQPGRLFRLTVTVPSDAAPTPGRAAELTVGSNHPKYADIRVPVRWVASASRSVPTVTFTNRAVLPGPASPVVPPPLPTR